jgi:hypothetical protein
VICNDSLRQSIAAHDATTGAVVGHGLVVWRTSLSLRGMLTPGCISVHNLLQGQRPPHTMCSRPTPHSLAPIDVVKDKCKKFADKYIEHDFVVLFIDIILIKPQVYRHLLYNRLGTADDSLNVASLPKKPSPLFIASPLPALP